jgi:hypothetical protein
VPTAGNLVAGELAINTADGKLFYKDSAGVVQTMASKATTAGTYSSITTSNLTIGTTQLGAGDASLMKNRIINGAMVIDQRNAGASGTSTGYTVDRWQYSANQSSKFTWQQNAGSVTPPVGFSYYLGFTSSSAYTVGSGDLFTIRQNIEGYNVADLGWGTANAKTVTISFWVRSSLTGTFGGAITNSAQDRSYPFTYTISSANTWTQASVTVTGDTSGTWLTTNGIGLDVRFGLGVGSTYTTTAGAWAAGSYFSATGSVNVVSTNGATFYITGVQLEVGSSATGYEYENYTSLLQKCQRYFVKDLQNASSATFLIGVVDTTTSADRCGMRFPVSMRTAPTAAVGGTANPRIFDGSVVPDITSIGSNTSSSFGASLRLVGSGGGLTLGRAAIIIENNASFFTYSAEL